MTDGKCSECKRELVLDEENLCAYCELTMERNRRESVIEDKDTESVPNVDCGICKVLVEEDSEGLFCDVCNTWFHNDCNETPLHYDLYALLNDAPQNVKWFCDKCIWETEKWITQLNDKQKNNSRVRKVKKKINGLNNEAEKECQPNTLVNEQLNGKDYKYVNIPNTEEQIDTQHPQIPEIKLEINHEPEFMECEDTHDAADSDEWIPPEEKEEVVKVKPKKIRKKNISLKSHKESTSKIPEEVVPEHLLNMFDISEENLPNFLAEIHTIKNSKKKRSKCTLCIKKFIHLEDCIVHNLKVHKGIEKPHKCPVCKEMFKTKHMRIKHMEKHDDTLKLRCDICDKKLKNHTSLRSHLKLFHVDVKFHNCTECDFTSKYKNYVTKHMIRKHSPKFPCEVCNKNFKTVQKMEQHLQKKHSARTFECIECGKKFKSENTRDKHTQIEHAPEKPFECKECGKKYPTEEFLNEHIKRHEKTNSGILKVICDICGKILSSKRNLQKHIMWHNDEKPFKCEICGKEFRESFTLDLHIKRHKKLLPFSCELCGYQAPSKRVLNIHIKEVHTNETPFECDSCGNKYKTKGNLSKHKRGIRGSCKGIKLSDSLVHDKRLPETSGMSINEHNESKQEILPIHFQENFNTTSFTSAIQNHKNDSALLMYANSHNSNVYLTQYQGSLIPPNSRGITATVQHDAQNGKFPTSHSWRS